MLEHPDSTLKGQVVQTLLLRGDSANRCANVLPLPHALVEQREQYYGSDAQLLAHCCILRGVFK